MLLRQTERETLEPENRKSTPTIAKNVPALLGLFSYLHPPYVIILQADPVSGFKKKNVVLIRDKCSYAYCKQTDTIAFCGGLEPNYLLSQEVCFLRLNDSTYKTSTMNKKRMGPTSIFVEGELVVAGGRGWDEKYDNKHSPYSRPLVLSDSFERIVKLQSGDVEWQLFSSVPEVQRCFASAVAIKHTAYLLGGYRKNDDFHKRRSPAATNSVAIYDKPSARWTEGPRMHQARAECGVAAMKGVRLFVAGGVNEGHPVHGIEMLDLRDKIWTEIKKDPPLPLGPCTACCIGNTIYTCGQLHRNLLSWKTEEGEWDEVLQLPHIYEYMIPVTKLDIIRRHSS